MVALPKQVEMYCTTVSREAFNRKITAYKLVSSKQFVSFCTVGLLHSFITGTKPALLVGENPVFPRCLDLDLINALGK